MSNSDLLLIMRADELIDRLKVRIEHYGVLSIDMLLDALADSKLTLSHDDQAANEAFWAYQRKSLTHSTNYARLLMSN